MRPILQRRVYLLWASRHGIWLMAKTKHHIVLFLLGISLFIVQTHALAISVEQRWLQKFEHTSEQSEIADSFPFASCFRLAALEQDLPLSLLLAVARGESNFDPFAISKANAIGVMQIQWPGTAKHLGVYRKKELYKPCINIRAGSRYLRELMNKYDNNVHLSLAAYNYGPSRIGKSGRTIPKGAMWYSQYILQHHDFVTGYASETVVKDRQLNTYLPKNHFELIRFSRPYRAEAFYQFITRDLPAYQFSWFRLDDGVFSVVVRYQSERVKLKIKKELAEFGLL